MRKSTIQPPGVSYESPVTCEKLPIVLFNSTQWNDTDRVTWAGLYAFNLGTNELSVCIAKNALPLLEPHLRAWVTELILLSDDARKLYMNVGIEKEISDGTVVHYFLASLDLIEKRLELLSPLKDMHLSDIKF